jgi:hypothetical protein
MENPDLQVTRVAMTDKGKTDSVWDREDPIRHAKKRQYEEFFEPILRTNSSLR